MANTKEQLQVAQDFFIAHKIPHFVIIGRHLGHRLVKDRKEFN